jgi:hypothetical protein
MHSTHSRPLHGLACSWESPSVVSNHLQDDLQLVFIPSVVAIKFLDENHASLCIIIDHSQIANSKYGLCYLVHWISVSVIGIILKKVQLQWEFSATKESRDVRSYSFNSGRFSFFLIT